MKKEKNVVNARGRRVLITFLTLFALAILFASCSSTPNEVQSTTQKETEGLSPADTTKQEPAMSVPADTTKQEPDDSTSTDTIGKHVHTWTPWVPSKEATCTEAGEETRTCTCGEKETQSITAPGHSYESVVTAPTCTEKGYTTYTCKCGDSYVGDYVKETGHRHESVVTAPTCTEKGYTTYTCNCGDSYQDDYTDPKHIDEDNDKTCDKCSYLDLAPGLYDANNNLLASWDALVNTYGMKVDVDYTYKTCQTQTTSPCYLLTNNGALQNGAKLVVGDVTSIGNWAFYRCTSLTTVTVSDSVTSIGEYAFSACENLTSVVVGNGVTSIGARAFSENPSITTITKRTSLRTRI